MAGKRKDRGVWEDSFEDISSFSQNSAKPDPIKPSRTDSSRRPSGRPQAGGRRPEPEWEFPEWEIPDRVRRPGPARTSSPKRDRPAPSNRPDRRPPPRKRVKKQMGPGARRAVTALTVLVMAAATILLAIFLLFKVSDIQVTGDTIEGCQNADILETCGYHIGDNLVFLSTRSAEKRLEEQFPYVGEAKISRRFPNTIEIHLTAARVSACVSAGGGWLCLSEAGKILENRDQPLEGVLQITGLSPLDTEPGQMLRMEDEDAESACRTVLTALADLSASEDFSGLDFSGFTLLDFSDLSQIRLFYKNRVEFQLGSILDLEYKVGLGCTSLQKMETEGMGSGETGILDLSDAGDTKKAIFTAGKITLPNTQAAAQAEPQPQNGTPDKALPAASSESPRGEVVPDTPYTGEAPKDSGGEEGESEGEGGEEAGGTETGWEGEEGEGEGGGEEETGENDGGEEETGEGE